MRSRVHALKPARLSPGCRLCFAEQRLAGDTNPAGKPRLYYTAQSTPRPPRAQKP